MTTVVAVVTDLIFASKIASTAASLGVRARVARSIEELSSELDSGSVAMVVVDLEADGVDAAEAIRRCREAPGPPRTVAFGPHVRTDLLESARLAGADEVMPRSAFAARCAAILRSVATA